MDTLDATDLAILAQLQLDASTPQSDIARSIGLSGATVSERIKRLETSGVIRRYAALLEPELVGADLTAFIEVHLDSPKNEAKFLAEITQLSEVLECHHVTGDASLLLKVRTHTRASLKNVVMDAINASKGVTRTKTTLVLESVKEEVALPLKAEATSSRSKND